MVIPATRDGKDNPAVFLFPGAGHLTKQSGFRGAIASVRAWAHTLQSSIHLSLFSHRPHTARWCLDILPVTLWTLVTQWQGL